MSTSRDLVAPALRNCLAWGWRERPGEDGVILLSSGDRVLVLRVGMRWIEVALSLAADGGLRQAHEPALAPEEFWFRALDATQSRFLSKYSRDNSGALLLRAELPRAGAESADVTELVKSVFDAADAPPGAGLGPFTATIGKPRLDDGESEIRSEEVIRRYIRMLDDRGWVYKDRLAKNHFRALQIGRERSFDVFLSLNHAWAYFQVPLLTSPKTPHVPPRDTEALMYDYLLRENDLLPWAKLGVDEDGQVVLGLDIPLRTFDFERFRAAAHIIERVAAGISYEIQILASLLSDEKLKRILIADLPRRSGRAHVRA